MKYGFLVGFVLGYVVHWHVGIFHKLWASTRNSASPDSTKEPECPKA